MALLVLDISSLSDRKSERRKKSSDLRGLKGRIDTFPGREMRMLGLSYFYKRRLLKEGNRKVWALDNLLYHSFHIT